MTSNANQKSLLDQYNLNFINILDGVKYQLSSKSALREALDHSELNQLIQQVSERTDFPHVPYLNVMIPQGGSDSELNELNSNYCYLTIVEIDAIQSNQQRQDCLSFIQAHFNIYQSESYAWMGPNRHYALGKTYDEKECDVGHLIATLFPDVPQRTYLKPTQKTLTETSPYESVLPLAPTETFETCVLQPGEKNGTFIVFCTKNKSLGETVAYDILRQILKNKYDIAVCGLWKRTIKIL